MEEPAALIYLTVFKILFMAGIGLVILLCICGAIEAFLFETESHKDSVANRDANDSDVGALRIIIDAE